MIPPRVSRDGGHDGASSLVDAAVEKNCPIETAPATSKRSDLSGMSGMASSSLESEPCKKAQGEGNAAAGCTKTPELPGAGMSNDNGGALKPCAPNCNTAEGGDDACAMSMSQRHTSEGEGVRGWEPRRRTSDGRATLRVFVAGRNGFKIQTCSPSTEADDEEHCAREQQVFCAERSGDEGDPAEGNAFKRIASGKDVGKSTASEDDAKTIATQGEVNEGRRSTEAVPLAQANAGVETSGDNRAASPTGSADGWSLLKVSIPKLKTNSGNPAQGPPTSSLTPPPRAASHERQEALASTDDALRNTDNNQRSVSGYPEPAAKPDERRGNHDDASRRPSSKSPEAELGTAVKRIRVSETSAGESKTAVINLAKGPQVPEGPQDVSGKPDVGNGAGSSNGSDSGGDIQASPNEQTDNKREAQDDVRSDVSDVGSTRDKYLTPSVGNGVGDASRAADSNFTPSPHPTDSEEAHGKTAAGADEKIFRDGGDESCTVLAKPDASAPGSGGEIKAAEGAREAEGTSAPPREGGNVGSDRSDKADGSATGGHGGEAGAESGGATMFAEDKTSLDATKVAAVGSCPPSTSDKRESKSESMVEISVRPSGEFIYSLKPGAPRRGKWCHLEQEYAKKIIGDFDEGLLDVEPGTGLRQLLASKLQCEVMRVSKKFCGLESVGKRSFRPVRNQEATIEWAQANLFAMEQRWLKSFFPNNAASRSAHEAAIPVSSESAPPSLLRFDSSPRPMDRDVVMSGFDRESPRWQAHTEGIGDARNLYMRGGQHYGAGSEDVDPHYTATAGRDSRFGETAWLTEDERYGRRVYTYAAERHAPVDGRGDGHHPAMWSGDCGEQRWSKDLLPHTTVPGGGADLEPEYWQAARDGNGIASEDARGTSSRYDNTRERGMPTSGRREYPECGEGTGGYVPEGHARHPDRTGIEKRGPLRPAGWSHVSDPSAQTESARRELPRGHDFYQGESDAVAVRTAQRHAASTGSGGEANEKDSLYPIYSKKDRYDTADPTPPQGRNRTAEDSSSTESRACQPQPVRGRNHQRVSTKRPYSPFLVSRQDGDAARAYRDGGIARGGDGTGVGWREHHGSDVYSAGERQGRDEGHLPQRYQADRSYGYNPEERDYQYADGRGSNDTEQSSGSVQRSRGGWRPVEPFHASNRATSRLPPHLQVDANSNTFFPGDSSAAGGSAIVTHSGRQENASREAFSPTSSRLSRPEVEPRRALIMEPNEKERPLHAAWADRSHERHIKSRRLPDFYTRGGRESDGSGEGEGSREPAAGDRRAHPDDGYTYGRIEPPRRRWVDDSRSSMRAAGVKVNAESERCWSPAEKGRNRDALAVASHHRAGKVTSSGRDRPGSSFTVPVGGGIVMPQEGHVVLRVGQGVAEIMANGNGGQSRPDRTDHQR